jgi:hypothetical protein
MPPTLRRHLRVLSLYSLFALILTWPLATHFTTHMPGNAIDDPSLGWNLWWIKTRLVVQANPDIFHVGWMFHPIDINLAFYTLTPLNGLLSVPLQTSLSLIIANNLILLSSFVLSGYGMFLLVRSLLPPAPIRSAKISSISIPISPITGAAFFAGLIYAFAAPKLFYAALGQYNIASSQWIPFCVLYVLRIGQSRDLRGDLRNAALAGAFLIFQTWAELTYASFLLIFIAIYFLWLLVSRLRPGSPPTLHAFRLTLPFFLMALIFALGLFPFLWAMLPDLRTEGDFFTSGGGFSDTFSADLAGYLLPTRLHPLLGEWVARLPFPNDVGQQIFLGYSVLALALLGAWRGLQTRNAERRTQTWFWLLTTLFFWWLTLGPYVRWLGQPTPIPGPFGLISLLPFFNGNRYPSRYGVMVLVCVAVLAGWGGYRVLRAVSSRSALRSRVRITHYALSTVLVTLFLLEHLSLPLPLNDFRIPPIYQTLAQQPGDLVVLELPTGWRNGARVLGKSDELIMMQQWYQTAHGKRRLGGNTSRNPPYKFQYFTDAPLIGDLIALMVNDGNPPYRTPVIEADWSALIERNRPIAGQVLHDLGIGFVVVHVEKSPAALLRFIDEVLPLTPIDEWQGDDWAGNRSTIRLYRVDAPPDPSPEINLANEQGKLYLAEGWSALTPAAGQIRYATRASADLLLTLPAEGGRLELELFGPATGAELWHDGVQLGTIPLDAESGQWLAVELPPGQATRPVERVTVRFLGPLTPVTALLPGGAGPALAVQSTGKDVGDFAHIWLNGVDVAVGTIGYNLAAIAPDGQLLERVAFNTHADPNASAALVAWVQQWPPGTIIAGAVMDTAADQLSAEAVAALATLGVAGDLRGKLRWSHAFIGAVGAPAGSAQEALGLLQPATVYTGPAVAGAAVSGGVGRVRISGP